MSARAACRLETLGFTRVYDYAAGKNDWMAAELPRDGKFTAFPSVIDATRRDVPTCALSDTVGDARTRADAAGADLCVVVAHDRTVLGLLRGKALHGDPDASAESAMEAGPTTFRPDGMLANAASHLVKAGARRVLVTTPEGRLIGVLDRDEAVRRTGGTAPEKD
jgi:CBS domain-containing protein